MALQVEMVVNGGVNGGEFLQTSHTTKALHRPFSSPNRLVTDIDSSLVQQVFDISKRKRKTDIHHYSSADDLGRRLEVAKWRRSCHPKTLRNRPALFKSVFSDTAVQSYESFRHAIKFATEPQLVAVVQNYKNTRYQAGSETQLRSEPVKNRRAIYIRFNRGVRNGA